GHSSTAVAAVFVTSGVPFRSRIGPRGAWTGSERNWLFCAVRRYCVPCRTCSAQRRSTSAPNTRIVSTPRIASRSARRGVSRYGSSMFVLGGRKRRDGLRVAVLAKQPDLLRALAPVERAQQPAAEPEGGSGQHEVEHDRWEHAA